MASLNPITGLLGVRRAAHLLRRCSFHYTRSRVDALAAMTPTEALADLLTTRPLQLEQPVYGTSSVTWINPAQGPGATLPGDDDTLTRYVMGWWVHEALKDTGAGHKIEFFLHQFLAVDGDSGSSSQFFDYLQLLRWGQFGNYKKLVAKMIVDNCMLNYINNNINYVNNPNENYARELFELHTIGRGASAGPGDYTNYTEEDIVQAARVLTGFGNALRTQNIDLDTNLPAGRAYPQSHDFQPKTFSTRFNGTVITPAGSDSAAMTAELNAMLDMIFLQEATSLNICRRLYHVFVTRKISAEAETDIITGMAQTLRDNDFELLPVLTQLLQSQHFFDEDDTNPQDEILGALIKSPLDLSLQALSFFEVPIPDPITDNNTHYNVFYNAAVLERMLSRTGMNLFYPPDVAGYPGYYQEPDFNRQFFNSATIVGRYKLPQILLTGTHAWVPFPDQSIGTKLDISAWIAAPGNISDASDASVLVTELLRYLCPEVPDADRTTYFLDVVFLDGLPAADWTYEWENYLISGDDTEVKIPLGRLLNAIMYAPEYQLM